MFGNIFNPELECVGLSYWWKVVLIKRSLKMFEIIIYAFVGFIFIYAIVDRVCKCIEHKHLSEAVKKNDAKDSKEVNTDNYIL